MQSHETRGDVVSGQMEGNSARVAEDRAQGLRGSVAKSCKFTSEVKHHKQRRIDTKSDFFGPQFLFDFLSISRPLAQRGPGRVWPPPLQRQLAEVLHRRHSIVSFRNAGTKSKN